MTSKFIMLIGLPAMGKSTLIKTLFDEDIAVCSSDNYIEDYAKSCGKTYNEVFKEIAEEANKVFFEVLQRSLDYGYDVVVDRTNLSVKSRNKILSKVPSFYEKTAIIVTCKYAEDWINRISNRPGKNIPQNVIDNMISSFEYPVKEEGFDFIYEIHT